jgi:hypothetical protein
MPNTQFKEITLNTTNHTITATGPYEPGLTNVNDTDWHLIGTPVVVFMVVKNKDNPDGTPNENGDPVIVADGVGYMDPPVPGEPGSWTGTIEVDPQDPDPANLKMKVGNNVRAVGAAIQVKNDSNDPKNPPTVEVVTWCVRQTITPA